jgi:hypothetical protein
VSISPDELLGQLRETVERLAAAPDQQAKWLETNGCSPDELALELGDEVPGWFPRLEAHGLLTEGAKGSLVALNERLGAIDPNSDAWRRDGLANAPEWAEVRELAAESLRHLG